MELLPITRYNPTTGPILYRSLIGHLQILKVDRFSISIQKIFFTELGRYRMSKIHSLQIVR